MRIQSFPAILCRQPRVLILGSMPGRLSLERSQYYAHPRNHFWPIMGVLAVAGPDLPYNQRIAALQGAGIALWDVLQACEREGSLDGNIQTESEIANDIPSLLQAASSIQAVAFNGSKAWLAFRRLVLPDLDAGLIDRLECLRLPSTSPANAGLSFKEKLQKWRALQKYL